MNLHSAPQDVPQGRSGKAGRRLGPIAEGTGPAHRAWLEPLRDAVHGRGVTLDELQARTGRPKGHISELLRAVGRYPRWVFVRTVLLALDRPGLPYDAMRLRWVLAARDVGKRTSWIKDCLHEGGARHRTATASVPLDFLAFQQMHRPHYTRYASAFLRRPGLSKKAVDDVFTLLLMLWHDALASENPERFAWPMLRQTVLERAPKENGRPSLVEAAFDTVALDLAPDPVRQVEESMALFRAVGGSRPCSATSWSCCTCAEWRTPGRRTNWASPSPPYGPPHGTPSATCTPPCTRTAPPRRGSPVTSTIDQLLARARLHTAPYAPADIADTGGAPHPQGARGPGAAAGEPQRDRRGAARDLQALCETAVTRTAVVGLGDFLTHKLPQPSGARVLGCILLLTDAEDSARFWWQYAAGAGDSIASYCLYLHHLALGENHEAVWWRSQSAPPAPRHEADALDEPDTPDAADVADVPDVATVVFEGAARDLAADASLPTTLRVLRALRPGGTGARRGSGTVKAVMEYVSAAVSYVDDDLELPLPDPDFTDRIRALTAAAARPPRPGRRTPPRLPARLRAT